MPIVIDFAGTNEHKPATAAITSVKATTSAKASAHTTAKAASVADAKAKEKPETKKVPIGRGKTPSFLARKPAAAAFTTAAFTSVKAAAAVDKPVQAPAQQNITAVAEAAEVSDIKGNMPAFEDAKAAAPPVITQEMADMLNQEQAPFHEPQQEHSIQEFGEQMLMTPEERAAMCRKITEFYTHVSSVKKSFRKLPNLDELSDEELIELLAKIRSITSKFSMNEIISMGLYHSLSGVEFVAKSYTPLKLDGFADAIKSNEQFNDCFKTWLIENSSFLDGDTVDSGTQCLIILGMTAFGVHMTNSAKDAEIERLKQAMEAQRSLPVEPAPAAEMPATTNASAKAVKAAASKKAPTKKPVSSLAGDFRDKNSAAFQGL